MHARTVWWRMGAFCVCVLFAFAFALTQRNQTGRKPNRSAHKKELLLAVRNLCDFITICDVYLRVCVCDICECGKCQTRSHWVGFIGANRNRIIRLLVHSVRSLRVNSGRWIFRANGVRYFILLDTRDMCVFFAVTVPSPLRRRSSSSDDVCVSVCGFAFFIVLLFSFIIGSCDFHTFCLRIDRGFRFACCGGI